MYRYFPIYFFLILFCLKGSFIFSQEQEIVDSSQSEETEENFDNVDSSQGEETEERFDSFDDIFEDPSEDTIVKETDLETAPDHRNQFEKSKKITVKGNFIARGGLSFGWENLLAGGQAGAAARKRADIWENFDIIPGVYAKASLSFDARPDPVILIYGNFYTEFDPKESIENSWSGIVIDELFCDYNMVNLVYLRVGQFEMKWGQGRLFTPGNLMDGSDETISLRLNMPTVLNGISVSALMDERLPDADLSRLPKDLTYGILADKVFSNVHLSAGATYNYDEGLNALVSFKTVLWKIDFFGDGLLHYYLDEKIAAYNEVRFQALFGFFREWKNIELYGEYYFDGRIEGKFDHSVGIATAYKNILDSGVDIGLKWLHSFKTTSGQFLAGISFSPWKYLKLNIAFPIKYGNKILDEDFTEDLPVDQDVALLIFFEINAGF